MQRTTFTPPSADPSSSPAAHILLGRYRVLETNTSGGFGSVSICWDPRLQRRVAIKQMPLLVGEDLPQQVSTVDEALAEARTSSMLAHPNIVTVFDFEVDGMYSYLVMEYVDGLNLADLLARVEDGVLSFDECAHLVDSVASALAYAHENGVLHLDIKPANIMIDRAGTVKIADFGMATLASAAGYGGARGGTVGYMPPEQIEGAMVDERTDVFSLAVVVWQALTGSCPYAASTPEQSLELIRRGPSPTLSRIEPELAGVVEGTLLRALDPTPTARMASVEAFARDLVRALGDTQDGAESFVDLLNQTDQDEEPHPIENWSQLHVPITERLPWIGGAITRLLAAATAGYVAYQTIPHILPDSANALAFGTGGIAVASAAWPPLGGVLSLLSVIAAIVAQPARMAMPLALLISVVGIIWWITAGRKSWLAGPALTLGACLSSPLAGVGLAGFALRPGQAFVTAALGWLFCAFFGYAANVSFFANMLVGDLGTLAGNPTTWLMALGCGLAAMVCSILTSRNKIALCIVGQCASLVILIGSYAACSYVEKASFTNTLDLTALGVAVFLGATLCIASALVGGSITNQKGDDRA